MEAGPGMLNATNAAGNNSQEVSAQCQCGEVSEGHKSVQNPTHACVRIQSMIKEEQFKKNRVGKTGQLFGGKT